VHSAAFSIAAAIHPEKVLSGVNRFMKLSLCITTDMGIPASKGRQ